MKEYKKERFKWSESTYGCIDWECFGAYASTIPVPKIANIIKYMYDWQYNKKWETRIKEGGNKDEIEVSFKCPMGCGEDENHRHYMVCKEIITQTISERLKDGIKIWLKKTLCRNEFIRVIMAIIEGYQGDNLNIKNILSEVDSEKCKEFLHEQDRIGWDNFFKGFISKKLTVIQQMNYDEINKEREICGERQLGYKYTGEWWTKNFIAQLIYFALSHWQVRNDHEHKVKGEEEKREYRTSLIEKVLEYYKKRDEVGIENGYLFEMAPLTRCMKSNIQIEAWLKSVEARKKEKENVTTLLKYMKL